MRRNAPERRSGTFLEPERRSGYNFAALFRLQIVEGGTRSATSRKCPVPDKVLEKFSRVPPLIFFKLHHWVNDVAGCNART